MSFTKGALAVIIGVLVAGIVFLVCEQLNATLYKLPAGMDMAALDRAMKQLPVNGYVLILSGFTAGSLLGGMAATLIAGRQYVRPAIICGIILTVGSLINFFQIWHPTWFAITSFFCFIPCCYLGYLLVRRK